jgi:3-oxo-5-alpha-steroid 4-dehydrogenase
MVLLMLIPTQCEFLITLLEYAYWVGMILACVLVVVAKDTVGKWHEYGKLLVKVHRPGLEGSSAASGETIVVSDDATTTSQSQTISDRISKLTVPKTWFVWFYVIGFTWSSMILASKGKVLGILFEQLLICQMTPMYLQRFNELPLSCFIIHCAKRLMEEYLYVRSSKGSRKSQMHILGFLIGASFYLAVPLAFASGESIKVEQTAQLVFLATGITSFVLGSYHQLMCHQVLRRTRSNSAAQYSIPYGYFAEILIYIGFTLICAGCEKFVRPELLLALVFTVINLGITAKKSHRWYCNTFGESYTNLNRYVMIPWLF